MAMLTINISTLKNQLSAVLKKVKRGEEVLVMDRDHPVARLTAVGALGANQDEASLISNLEKRGIVVPAKKKMRPRKWIETRLVRVKGVSAVEALLKEREESM